MRAAALLLLCTLVAASSARKLLPSWRHVERADKDAVHTLTFVLKTRTAENPEFAAALARATSPNVDERVYLSLEEVNRLTAPHPFATKAVLDFVSQELAATSVKPSLGGDHVVAAARVEDIERALNTTMHVFRHASSGRKVLRAGCNMAAPPAHIAQHVHLVLGLHDFFDSREERSGKGKRTLSSPAAVGDNPIPGNMPYITRVNGNESYVDAKFVARCKDGSAPTDISTCSPKIDYFVAAIEGQEHKQAVADSQCASNGEATVCHATAVLSKAYVRTNITLLTVFTDKSTSSLYTYPTTWSPTMLSIPSSVHDQYAVPQALRRGTNKKNSQAIVSFEEQYWSSEDFAAFNARVGITDPVVPTIIGYNNDSFPGGEATLDVQWITGVGQGVPTTTWSFPDGDYILNWALAVANTTDAPIVTSISYGDTEIGYIEKSGYGYAYIERMNEELSKMATRGYTVIAGSGDAGWSNVGEAGNDLSPTDPTCSPMRAFYPSLSPYVTSLSAVFLQESGCVVSEVAISVSQGRAWTTGGGFSNYTAVLDYQADVVRNYQSLMSTSLPPSELWNRGGRGYPDMAALGENMLCIWNGVEYPLGGTSAAGPVAAGLISLLNDARLNKGKSPLGLLGPIFYQLQADFADAFFDVTVGQNNDGDIQVPGSVFPTFCPYGFPTAKGWDAVSGLGTPNMSRLFAVLV